MQILGMGVPCLSLSHLFLLLLCIQILDVGVISLAALHPDFRYGCAYLSLSYLFLRILSIQILGLDVFCLSLSYLFLRNFASQF